MYGLLIGEKKNGPSIRDSSCDYKKKLARAMLSLHEHKRRVSYQRVGFETVSGSTNIGVCHNTTLSEYARAELHRQLDHGM
jgi:hypothetical protein